MMTKQELEKEFRELEVYADNLRKSNEQIQRSLDETNEQLRIAKAKEKEWRQKSSNDSVELDEWKKMSLHLMEQLVATKAKLEIANLPF
ncbi:MAG: hypothetical protein PUB71_03595 [Hallerella succinigenes]|uniref:hypothetical protein n=1 Tax=Hallerella succinigenes TaxID=1896222 RepID=UPI0023F12CFF|nr:hypothetical protein [Hallerella succinigenes]MDD6091571.1 hypothetical protein [Hallerella succinigenes]